MFLKKDFLGLGFKVSSLGCLRFGAQGFGFGFLEFRAFRFRVFSVKC